MLRRTLAPTSIAFVLSGLISTSAMATSQRTFVASNGDDANPCSLVSPCRSFATAITQTTSGGEVIALDSAGYGVFAIAQSVSIIAPPGVYAGISVPAAHTGIIVAAAGANVVLRGLTINSAGGDDGIRMTNGAALMVDNCTVSKFTPGSGIVIETQATVEISRSLLRGNGNGIVAGYGAMVNITNSQVIETGNVGILLANGPPGSSTKIVIADSIVTGIGVPGQSAGIYNFADLGSTGTISATRIVVSNCVAGITTGYENLSGRTITISDSMITGNDIGFAVIIGGIFSLGNNHVGGNLTDVTGTLTKIPPS